MILWLVVKGLSYAVGTLIVSLHFIVELSDLCHHHFVKCGSP